MPPRKTSSMSGMDRMRQDMQECWIDPNSKYLSGDGFSLHFLKM